MAAMSWAEMQKFTFSRRREPRKISLVGGVCLTTPWLLVCRGMADSGPQCRLYTTPRSPPSTDTLKAANALILEESIWFKFTWKDIISLSGIFFVT